MSRRLAYPRRKLRAAFRSFAKEAWAAIAVMATTAVAITVWILLTEPSRFLQGLTVGVTVTAFTGAFCFMFLMASGNIFTLAGIWAERFATDSLKKARRRGHIWGYVNNIEIGSQDVDFLVATPSGIIAIEVKAHTVKINRSRALSDVADANRAADKAASILRSEHVQCARSPRPVLVVWGRRSTATLPPEGRLIDGVHVVALPDLDSWLAALPPGDLTKDEAREVVDRVRAFRDSRSLKEISAVV